MAVEITKYRDVVCTIKPEKLNKCKDTQVGLISGFDISGFVISGFVGSWRWFGVCCVKFKL